MKAYMDGDALCVVKDDFVDLVKSPAFFVTLTEEQQKEFEVFMEKENRMLEVGVVYDAKEMV